MRKLKIYAQSMSGSNYTQVPTILLKGKWFEERGFNMGDYVAVEFVDDKIVLSKTTKPEPKSVQKSIEEKINNLDKKQLKELNEYLSNLKK